MDNTLKPIVLIAAVIGVAGAAVVIYKLKDRIKGMIKEFRDSKPVTTTPVYDVRSDEPKQTDSDGDLADSKASPEFLMYADNFSGLYEKMCKVSEGILSDERMKNILTQWRIRMDNIPNMPSDLKKWRAESGLTQLFSSRAAMQECAQKIMRLVDKSGIKRDSRIDFKSGEDISLYYQDDDDKDLSAGMKVRVCSPCWYLPSEPVRIIEKGICTTI